MLRTRLRCLVVVALALGVLDPIVARAQQPAPQAPPAETQLPAPKGPVADKEPPAPAAPPSTPATVPAPVALPQEVAAEVGIMAGAIENAERSLKRIRDAGDDLGRLRNEADRIITETTRIADTLRPQLLAARRQLDRLGPPPARDAPAEAPTVAAERARLLATVAALDGAIKTLELTWGRARELIEKITDLRYSLFTRSLLERTQSPLMPELWRRAASDAPSVGRFAQYVVTEWWALAKQRIGALALWLAAAVGAYLGIGFLIRSLERKTAAAPDTPPPTFFERAQRIVWLAPARMLPGLAAIAVVYAGFHHQNLLYFPADMIARALVVGVATLVAIATLVWTVLSPHDPSLRLVDISRREARRTARYLTLIAGVFALDGTISDIGRALVMPLSMTVVQTFVASLAYVGLLIALLTMNHGPAATRATEGTVREEPPVLAPWWVKGPLWMIAALILIATMTGYVALGRFIAQQLVLTGAVALATGLGTLAIRAITRLPSGGLNPLTRFLETQFGMEESRRREFAWLAEALLTLLLLLVAVPLVLVQWGFAIPDIRDWIGRAFFGFEIGQFRISLARILLGFALFMVLLFFTRLLQRWLRERVLGPRRVDSGIAHSIETAFGYAGIALAAVLAISYGGLDITNLAIVAGALSVGIGFGLQSIVNNFVSGLILLIERPIKVGDWIVVGDQQGNVRRISVRSTEIETFDRASLIIPNAELITGRVLNWTHRNMLGRAVITVGTAYDADPERVIAILLACAQAHPEVLTEPPPGATFESFAASSLDFTLRVHVSDVTRSGMVKSQIRVAILKAFRGEGIEIPYSQHDVHLRDLDGVRSIVSRLIEQRAAQNATPVDAKAPPDGST